MATMAQVGWNSANLHVDQSIIDFMDVFYGPAQQGLIGAYTTLHTTARFLESTWNRQPSKVRGPAYGNSRGKGPVGRVDLTLEPPVLPRLPELRRASDFRTRHQRWINELPSHLRDNEVLIRTLLGNLGRVERNRYNLEVLLSLARFMGHHLVRLDAMEKVDADLDLAEDSNAAGQPGDALAMLRRATARVEEVIEDQRSVFAGLQGTWEKSRHPRNAPAGGRTFLHVMDDVKDHFADRRPDLSYLNAPEDSMDLPAYLDALREIIRQYGTLYGAGHTVVKAHEPPPME